MFEAEVAQTPVNRTRGLSYRESLTARTGMLFVFERPRLSAFWMKEMRFPLDFIWIGADCTVVDITPDVPNPPPDTPDSALPTYRPDVPVAYNFEINAGEANQYKISVGDRVSFSGFSVSAVNGAGC